MKPHRLLILLLIAILPFGCSSKRFSKPADVDYYTCAMHPSVHAEEPGNCPICGMTLIAVMKKAQGHSGPSATAPDQSIFVVSPERQQQIGVTYAAVERKPVQHSIRAVGAVAPDKSRHWEFVARVDGYVQTLYVTAPGQLVEKGQPLLEIYAPDLLATERELVELLRMRDQSAEGPHSPAESTNRLIEAAERRLRQWNVTAEQITEVEKSRKPSETLTLLSPFRGIVESVPVDPGRGIKMGDHLVDVVGLDLVWVWADFYQNELPEIRRDQHATVTSQSLPGEQFDGVVAEIDPLLNNEQRTAKIRIDIQNPALQLRPGMFVDVQLNGESRETLTIPVSAVMPTGRHNLVFVDKGEGRLEPRHVDLGAKLGDLYEVRSGVHEGERVVASANFLIDAEAKLQNALGGFAEDANGQHHHHD